MHKECTIVMLATKEKSKLKLYINNPKSWLGEQVQNEHNLVYNNVLSEKAYNKHLYIISNDKIKENTHIFNEGINGDWFYNTKFGFIANTGDITEFDFKIIATTDSTLAIEPYQGHFEEIDCTNYLPSIPQSFIDYYISEYNKGNKIEKVMVEYDKELASIVDGSINFILKLNSDNTINIKPIKDSWTREEVVELIKLFNFKYGSATSNDAHNWINNNL